MQQAPLEAPPSSSFAQIGSWSDLVGALRLFVALLAIGVVATALVTWGDVPTPPRDVATSALMALVVLGFGLTRRRELWPLLRTSGFGGRGALYALISFGILVGFATFYFQIVGWLGFRSEHYIAPYVAACWPLWSVFVLVSFVPALVEEIAFRGYIMQRLEHSAGRREALFIQAALFSVLHLAPVVFISHFVMGMVFGILRNKTRSLYPGMLVHALYNASVLAAELAGAW